MNREEQIAEYIDGLLLDSEMALVADKINTDAEWQEVYESQIRLHILLQKQPLLAPSQAFTTSVMAKIATEKQPLKVRDLVVENSLLIGLVLVFFGLFNTAFIQSGIAIFSSISFSDVLSPYILVLSVLLTVGWFYLESIEEFWIFNI